MTLSNLNTILVTYCVPTHAWGTGHAKTVEHLLEEINNNECLLSVECRELVRYTRYVAVQVRFVDVSDGCAQYVLKEDRQVFTDGRVRRRTLNYSLGEKLKRDESFENGAYRALEEELGIDDQILPLRHIGGEKIRDRTSSSYPGLLVDSEMEAFEVILSPQHFMPDGYVEVQKDKTTYFVWEKVDR